MLKDLLVKADVEATLLEDVASKVILEADLWKDVVCKAPIEDDLRKDDVDQDVVSKLLLRARFLQAMLLEETW